MDCNINLNNVTKDFVLRHNKHKSLKSKVVAVFKRQHKESTEQFRAVNNVSLRIPHGRSLAVLGHNGSGKSTLLKLIAGIIPPTSGTIAAPPPTTIGTMISLGVGFNRELTGMENIYLNASLYGYSSAQVDEVIDEIIAFSELAKFIDTPLRNYSSGMYARLGFSIMSHLQGMQVLLIDEILGVGDAAFKDKCKIKMKSLLNDKKTIVFVSHAPQAIRQFCDYACIMDHGKLLGVGKLDKVAPLYSQLLEKSITPDHVVEHLKDSESLMAIGHE